jgi:hypothetical protein
MPPEKAAAPPSRRGRSACRKGEFEYRPLALLFDDDEQRGVTNASASAAGT